MELLFRNLSQAVETDNPDPASLLLGGTEGQTEGSQTLIIGFPVEPALGVMAQVAAESDVVNHGVSSFSKRFCLSRKALSCGASGRENGVNSGES
jgi:hypothetical protein